MINLEIPRKFEFLVGRAHQVATAAVFTAAAPYLAAQHRRALGTAAWEDWFGAGGIDLVLEPTLPLVPGGATTASPCVNARVHSPLASCARGCVCSHPGGRPGGSSRKAATCRDRRTCDAAAPGSAGTSREDSLKTWADQRMGLVAR